MNGKVVVCLLPVRTSTVWFHKFAMRATEIRFMKGHLKFKNYVRGSPFGCMVVIFDGRLSTQEHTRMRSANLKGELLPPIDL